MPRNDLYIVDQEYLQSARTLAQDISLLQGWMADFVETMTFLCSHEQSLSNERIKDKIINKVTDLNNTLQAKSYDKATSVNDFLSRVDQADDVLYGG
jgi:hypothetical protein